RGLRSVGHGRRGRGCRSRGRRTAPGPRLSPSSLRKGPRGTPAVREASASAARRDRKTRGRRRRGGAIGVVRTARAVPLTGTHAPRASDPGRSPCIAFVKTPSRLGGNPARDRLERRGCAKTGRPGLVTDDGRSCPDGPVVGYAG